MRYFLFNVNLVIVTLLPAKLHSFLPSIQLKVLLMKFFLCAILFLSSLLSFSQTKHITGSVKDTSTKEMVQNAVVALLSPKDSVFRDFGRTNAKGEFSLQKARPGDYILLIMHSSYADYVDNIHIKEDENVLGTISITPKSKLLQEVIVKGTAAIRVKGDTTIFAADSFKVSANANVEELLKKLPGLQVDKDGKISAMGKTVEKVLVDGEEFFGEDPGIAVKNLRADAVKEVQVFDKKSEQAEFTGIDDGKTQKTINLKLKEDKKKGYFGKIDLSAGPADNAKPRFNNNLLYGSFKGKRKISAFALNGNTGQDGLNWQDAEKYSGGSDNVIMDGESGFVSITYGGESSDGEAYVNTDNGFIRNLNLGANYNNKWKDKHTLSFSPKYNEQNYTNGNNTYIENYLRNDSVLISRTNKTAAVDKYNYLLRGVYDAKLDSNTTLKVTLNTNFYHSASESHSQSVTSGKYGNLKNETTGNNNTISDKNVVSGSANLKHKFKKDRRTLSFNTNWSFLNTESKTFINNTNIDYFYNLSSPIDQKINNDKSTIGLSAKATYTEPLNKKYALEFSHELSFNKGLNNQLTYSLNTANNQYDTKVDSLSNDFDQRITVQRPSIRLAYSFKKMKFNLGGGAGFTHFDLMDKTNNKEYQRNYVNYFPTANFNYTYKSNHNIGIGYNGNTRQPTLNQLQPLRNVNSLFYQYLGNPTLKPSFVNSININHNSYNFLKELWMYQSLNFASTSNAIVNKSNIDLANGKTTVQPVNLNGNYSLNFWSGAGYKFKKINVRLWTNIGGNFGRSKSILNDTIQTSNNTGVNLNYGFNKSKEKKYDFYIGNGINYSINKILPSTKANKIFNWELSANAEVYLTKSFIIGMDYQGNFQPANATLKQGLNVNLLNGSIKKTFKDNQFTIYLNVRDILNQNNGVSRYFGGNTYQEEIQQRLRRYALLGFRWDFKNKAPKATAPTTEVSIEKK